MKIGKYVIQYGFEPFFTNRMRREAEGALHHNLSLVTGAYVVTVNRYSDERTLNELVGYRVVCENKKDMARVIKKFKREFPRATVMPMGFD